MQSFIYDVGVVGTGVAGTFALLKLTKENNKLNVINFDAGSPPAKRRHQMYGFFGLFPNGDGKLYLNDLKKINNFTDKRKVNSALNYFKSILELTSKFEITTDNGPSASAKKRLAKLGYEIELNDYVQTVPKEIHALSKKINQILDKNINLISRYHTDIVSVKKEDKYFVLTDQDDREYFCKKVLFSPGRSGWRMAYETFKDLGISVENDFGKYGVRLETSGLNLKDFANTNCTIKSLNEKGELKWELGPISWNGTVIPEDHQDMAIASFRSNENRWKTDKVSFNLFINNKLKDKGMQEVDRLAKLSFILTNDRVSKEKITLLMAKKSKLSILPEYHNLIPIVKEVEKFIPEISKKSYFHAPNIMPLCGKIKTNKFQTKINGFYVAGESLGECGLLFSALTGILAADSILESEK